MIERERRFRPSDSRQHRVISRSEEEKSEQPVFATLGVLGISDRWASLSDDESIASNPSSMDESENEYRDPSLPILASRDRKTLMKDEYKMLRCVVYLLVLIFLLGIGMVAAGIVDLARH